MNQLKQQAGSAAKRANLSKKKQVEKKPVKDNDGDEEIAVSENVCHPYHSIS